MFTIIVSITIGLIVVFLVVTVPAAITGKNPIDGKDLDKK